MKIIDLRSDTVTKPSPGMRQAMAQAEVGDDVFEDDPTVKLLEEKVAVLFGQEASLFVPTGTMGNQVALRTWGKPGDELLLEEGAHIFNYEVGAACALSGLQLHPIKGQLGVITARQIESEIRGENIHHPRTRLVSIENTHNRAGGTIYPLDEMRQIRSLALQQNLKIHLDGARIWNAAIATGTPLSEYGAIADSIMTCLSKGLGAPIGSMIIGGADFIREARRNRKQLGGGMRQVGILAAAGLFALEHNYERLIEDHENARFLAQALAELPGLSIDLEAVETNIVVIDITASEMGTEELIFKLKTEGVLVVPFGANRIRAVTHLDISRADIQTALDIFKQLLGTRTVFGPIVAAPSGPLYRLAVDFGRLRNAFTDGSLDTNYFLNLKTGEIKMLSYLTREEEKEKINANRDDYLTVPKKSPKDGYHDMEEFIDSLESESLKERLKSAIQGKGAFRRFKDVLMGYPEERRRWFRFSEERDEGRLRRWLEQEGVAVELPVTVQ